MEENHKRVEDLMRLYGLEEKEARAAYHLGIAQELFEEISEEASERGGFPRVRGVEAWMHDEMDFGEHFTALRNQLARRVLQRDYPEGWGRRAAPSSEARWEKEWFAIYSERTSQNVHKKLSEKSLRELWSVDFGGVSR